MKIGEKDESNWFLKWEHELPSPEELIPLSQTLITPNLAFAFNIHNPKQTHPSPAPASFPASEFESSSAGGGSDEPSRTQKRPRLVWTPQLHKRFVDAVAHLGIKNAVPKTIMQLMSVDGLTRENVASHLQKYRLYLKRMQSVNNGGGPGGSGDPATDRLFASGPVPAHFLGPSGRSNSNSEHFMVALQYQQRQMEQNPFMMRQGQAQTQARTQLGLVMMQQSSGYSNVDTTTSRRDNNNNNNNNGGRKVLPLFPTDV